MIVLYIVLGVVYAAVGFVSAVLIAMYDWNDHSGEAYKKKQRQINRNMILMFLLWPAGWTFLYLNAKRRDYLFKKFMKNEKRTREQK